jgi:hypothetical protein
MSWATPYARLSPIARRGSFRAAQRIEDPAMHGRTGVAWRADCVEIEQVPPGQANRELWRVSTVVAPACFAYRIAAGVSSGQMLWKWTTSGRQSSRGLAIPPPHGL